MKSRKLKTLLSHLLLAAVTFSGCGGSKDTTQKQLKAEDELLFPNQGTQGAIDASKITEGIYSLKALHVYSVHGETKLLYGLELATNGDLSKEKDKFDVKTNWPKQANENEISISSVQVPTPLNFTSEAGTLTFNREATINLQASSDDKVEWSPGEQVATNTPTLLGSIFSSAAIRNGLVYRLLGKEGIVIQRPEGVSLFTSSQDSGSSLVVEFVYVRSATASPTPSPSPTTPGSNNPAPSFSNEPVSATSSSNIAYLRCLTDTSEVYFDLGKVTYAYRIGVRSLNSSADFTIKSATGSVARVSGETQISGDATGLSLFVITTNYSSVTDSELVVNGARSIVRSCLFVQNNIYAGKYGF